MNNSVIKLFTSTSSILKGNGLEIRVHCYNGSLVYYHFHHNNCVLFHVFVFNICFLLFMNPGSEWLPPRISCQSPGFVHSLIILIFLLSRYLTYIFECKIN